MAANNSNNGSFLKKSFNLIPHDSSEKSHNHTVVCLVKLANGQVHHIEITSKDVGGIVLSKICHNLGISDEREYFGLTYQGSKKETLWINLRNKIAKQVPGSSPYQMSLRVKYFVRPCSLIMEQTKEQFFLDIVEHLKDGSWGEISDENILSRMIALQTHVLFGPYNTVTIPCKYAIFWPQTSHEMPVTFIYLTAKNHRRLENVTAIQARYELMDLVYEQILYYGSHVFSVKDIFNKKMKMYVGPEFIFIAEENINIFTRYPYTAVNLITLATKVVNISFLDDSGTVKAKLFELTSPKLAQSLYRCITEMNAFFQSDNISQELINQTSSHTLNFLFDHKEYIFDVSHTAREVLEKTQRNIYMYQGMMASHWDFINPESSSVPTNYQSNENNKIKSKLNYNFTRSVNNINLSNASGDLLHNSIASHTTSRTDYLSMSMEESITSFEGSDRLRNNSEKSDNTTICKEEINEIVQTRLKQAHLCQICCDNAIARVFLPCGHALCCEKCSNCVEQCPMCRSSIQIRHPVFFPTIPSDYLPDHNAIDDHITKNDEPSSPKNTPQL